VAVECLRKWASSRLLELYVYTQTEIGALRSNRRKVVVTVLTRNSSLNFAIGSRYCRFVSEITPLQHLGLMIVLN